MKAKHWKLVWFVIALAVLALYSYRIGFMKRDDFIAYYNAGLRALSGESPSRFEETPFKYLPVISCFFAPLALLPYQAAKLVFFLISFVAGADLYRRVISRFGNAAALVLFLSFFRFHNYDFNNVQVNHLLLWVFVFFLSNRDTRPIRAAVAFASLASVKVMPVLLLGPLVFFGRIREVLRILFFLVALAVLPALVFDQGFSVYLDWYRLMKGTTQYPAPVGALFQSVQAAVWTLVHQSWRPETFVAVMAGAQAVLLAPVLAAAWRVGTEGDSRHRLERENAVLAAAMALSVIISPLAWKHNFLLLWPAVLFLVRARLRAVVVAQVVLMTVLPTLLKQLLPGFALTYDFSTLLGALVVFFSLLTLSVRKGGVADSPA